MDLEAATNTSYVLHVMRDTREHWSLTGCGTGCNFLSQVIRMMDFLYWQFPIHCFVIIDRFYFLSLTLHILAHFGISNCGFLYEFAHWLQ